MKLAGPALEYPRLDASLIYVQTSPQRYVVKQPGSGRYFRLSPATVRVMKFLDGTRSLEAVSTELGLDIALVRYVCEQLSRLRLLEGNEEQGQVCRTPGTRQAWAKFGRLLLLRKEIVSSDDWIERCYHFLRLKYIFRHWLGVALLALYIAGAFLYYAYRSTMSMAFEDLFLLRQHSLLYFLLFLIIGSISCVLHECAHAFSCKHFGGRVRSMGVGLYYFSPVLYTDISDAWLFPKRYQRLITHGAGLMMNFFLTSLALLLLLVGRANYWLMMIIAITFLASFVSVLVNFNPLIKLDGYYLLADAFGIDNLRDKAFSALFSSIQQVGYTLGLFKTPPLRRPGRNAHPRLETAFLFIFGLISFTYSLLLIPFILTRYTQLLTHMLGNWGWALNAVVLVLLVIAPVLRIWQSWQKIKRQRMMVQPYLLNKPEAALGKDP